MFSISNIINSIFRILNIIQTQDTCVSLQESAMSQDHHRRITFRTWLRKQKKKSWFCSSNFIYGQIIFYWQRNF